MLRLLALLVSLLAPVVAPSSEPSSVGGWTMLDVAMPAANAWVAYPVTAHADLLLDARVVDPGSAPGAHLASMFLTPIEGRDGLPGSGGGFGWSAQHAQANFDGHRVACCALPASLPVEMPRGTSEVDDLQLAAGETVWLALVVANADVAQPGSMGVRADGPFTVGERREGTDVRFVDLADEAYRGGQSVRLQGRALVGAPTHARADMAPETNGLAFAWVLAEGGSSLRFTLDAAGERLAERSVVREQAIHLAMGPQPVLSLAEDVRGDDVHAFLLLADVDLPGRGTFSGP